jgi:hypothetical protein
LAEFIVPLSQIGSQFPQRVHVKISDHFWNEVSQNDVHFEQAKKACIFMKSGI